MRAGLLMVGLLLLATSRAMAQGVRGMLRFGGDYGGESLVQFQYSDGTSPNVQAGGGLLAALGVVMSPVPGLDLQASAGVKYRTIPPASNQSANWLRVPLEGLVFFHGRQFRIGGGVAVHVANALSASGAALNGKIEFDTRPGYVMQAEYDLGGRIGLDVRYTLMKYEITRGGAGTVDANAFGAGVSFFFGGSRSHRRHR